jgi:DNA-binding Lrp family transcriptional regulator
MGRGTLTLDQIWSATSTFSVKWSEGVESNKARRILHYLLCRLYDEGRGQLVNARLTLAQTTLAKKLGMSRQWVGELVNRLEQAGWIEHQSSKLADGTNSSSVWRVGRMLKRLLVMLGKCRCRPQSKPAKSSWQFSPRELEKKTLSILDKEKEPLSVEVLIRVPLLRRWLERGKEKTEGER